MSYSVVDLFCGIGGLTKGLEYAGLNVVAGIDINETCRFAYEANNNAQFIAGDITNITSEEVQQLYPNYDTKILVGCAPCQSFSKYTQRYRKEGHKDDRWRLLYYFSKLIKDIKPQIISMENVPELANEKVFTDFVNSIESTGYTCSWQIVFCPEYGVPQKRKRLVLLASLLGHIDMIAPIYKSENYPTVRESIGQLPALENGGVDPHDPVHRVTRMTEKNIARIRQSIPGGTWRDWDEALQLNCHKKYTGRGYGAVYGRMCWDEPSPTITTQFYGYGNGRFGHPEQDRAISYREGAILQSFPPDYQFIPINGQEFSLRDLGTHIGNAVPVQLGRAIGLSILQHLKSMGAKNNECYS